MTIVFKTRLITAIWSDRKVIWGYLRLRCSSANSAKREAITCNFNFGCFELAAEANRVIFQSVERLARIPPQNCRGKRRTNCNERNDMLEVAANRQWSLAS
jgi:hypothetical protein